MSEDCETKIHSEAVKQSLTVFQYKLMATAQHFDIIKRASCNDDTVTADENDRCVLQQMSRKSSACLLSCFQLHHTYDEWHYDYDTYFNGPEKVSMLTESPS